METDTREIKLIYNSVLNLIFRANKAGNASKNIVSKSAHYYKPDILLKAKEILWHFGIVLHIPDDAAATDLCRMIENCLKAERIRNTRSYK